MKKTRWGKEGIQEWKIKMGGKIEGNGGKERQKFEKDEKVARSEYMGKLKDMGTK